MFTKLISALKATRRTIVFTEGPDARILEAADRLIKDDLMDVILIGNVDEVKAAAAKGGFDIAKAEIIDPATYAGMDEMVAKMVELRKGKMSEEDCRAALAKGNYFGTMLVKMGKADALLGGATYSTADTVRPALQLVKTKKGAHLVSSSFILFRKDKDGNFIWPGYGDNMRVLDWILRRAKGKAEGQKTVLGVSPTYAELDKTGLDYSEEQFNANMALNPSEWQAELESQTELFDKVGKKLPAELEEQRQLLIKSFS